MKVRLVVALAAMSILLPLTSLSTVAAEPAATPPVNDVGPVDWGDPPAAPVVHAPSTFGRIYPPRTQAARDWAFRTLGPTQFRCLDHIFHYESGWRVGAYGGIPQARPPEKMRSAGADWKTNPMTQVKWGIRYVNKKYGSACKAWAFKQRNGWY